MAIVLMESIASVRAALPSDNTVIPINNGMNRLTLDGEEAVAFRAWRENFNAHGFDVISFYVRDKADDGASTWNLVPIFGSYENKDASERDLLTVGGGADCKLHDFRLVQSDGHGPMRLIVADRDLGASYADAATVHFSYFELAKNEDGVPGWPPLYFKLKKTTLAAQKYCDVDEALDTELHISSSGPSGH
ncbi:hypothetical protein [Dyella sp. C9]|uniref:carbapenem self-resistance protein CarG family protein n=1 Tax=Dyella sp. C9 TaxID=2202154 RepID=UPI0013009D6C|nr:hypothetical protein [Dyella sp. C9]